MLCEIYNSIKGETDIVMQRDIGQVAYFPEHRLPRGLKQRGLFCKLINWNFPEIPFDKLSC